MAVTIYLSDGTTQVGYGAVNKVTDGSFTRHIDVDWGEMVRTQFGHPKPYGAGRVRTGEAWTESRIITGVITTEYSGSNAERNILDEVNDDLPALFNPSTDTWDLRVDRTDSGGSATSRILTVETIQIPDEFEPQDIRWEDGSFAWARWPFVIQAAFPMWRDRTATTQAVTVSNVDATSATGAWTTIDNSGFEETGMKFVISGISGTITSVTIDNTTNSKQAIWGDDTALANSDALDFLVDDPQVVNWTAGNTLNAVGDMILARGNNDGTFTVAGSSSPACTVTISYRKLYRGF